MKQAIFSSIVLSFLSTSAFAQSSTSAMAPAANAPAAASTVSSDAPAKKSPISVRYVGIYSGPNFNADGHTMGGVGDTFVSNRPSIQTSITDNFTAGVQARLRTTFTKEGVVAGNESWRLYGNINNVASYGIASLSLIPRIMLPTSNANHNNKMTASPELLMAFSISPSDSRFSFSYTPQMQMPLYTDESLAKSRDLMSFLLLHNIEGTYQLGASTQLTFGFYPEYVVTKNLPFTNDSNEIDVGVNFDIAKGWSINPYIGFEAFGANSDNLGKSMQAALSLSGTFL